MRITLLTQWFDPEPGAMRGLPLASWLARHGHEVQVITGFPNYPQGRLYPGYAMKPLLRERLGDVSVLRLPLYPSHDRSPARRLLNYSSFALSAATIGTFSMSATDVVYTYHPPPTVGLASSVWRRVRSVPFVYHIADMWPESVTESGMLTSPRLRRVADSSLSALCSFLYRSAAAITVLSPGFKRILIDRGVPADKVTVIWNWTDEDVFRPQAPDPQLGAKLGLNHGFRILYAGNLGSFQALPTAIRAANRVRHLPGFELCLAGTGNEEESLRSLAQSIGSPNVRFLGQQPYDQMGALNAFASALLVSLRDLPFLSATVPSKTQAALASGRPVIMAVAGDAAELVDAAEGGIVVPPEDEDAMASAFERLYYTAAPDLDAMGARGRRYYEEHLSLEAGARRTEELLQEVVTSRGAGLLGR